MTQSPQFEILPDAVPREGVIIINARCRVRTQDGHRIVVVAGAAVASFAVGDHMAEAAAMVLLVEQGYARQREVARAFSCSARSVRRYAELLATGGLVALCRQPGWPKGRARRLPDRDAGVVSLRQEGHSNREVARRLGFDEKTVRKALRRSGWREPSAVQGALDLGLRGADSTMSAISSGPPQSEASAASEGADPMLSAISNGGSDGLAEPLPWSLDTDPADRRLDRVLAYLGGLADAAPLFAGTSNVAGAGVLLAVPALVASGVLECARDVYGSIGPAFYGLRTTLMTMLLMALLRIRRPENLKEHCPVELGRVLGLDRAPEVKTLRRKLARLGKLGRAADFGRALARHRIASRGSALGFLYVDGHVRVYHGKREIPKAHVTRMRISMPGTTDYWVNDHQGEPLFVVTAEANAGLVAVLPPLLAEMRALVGPRRVTVVFDRGGWSPTLFRQIINAGFDVLPYRKGRYPAIEPGSFASHEGVVDGRTIRYVLADQTVDVTTRRGPLQLRQVTRLSANGHQPPILTNRQDLPAIEVAQRMFDRWRQENFFKYLRDEYAIDALVDYDVEPDDPERTVPNPARKPLTDEISKLRTELNRPETDLALRAVISGPKPSAEPMRALGQKIVLKIKRLISLEAKRDALPARIPVKERVPDGLVIKLATERKHLSNVIKMVAYQAESDLVHLIEPHFHRADDEGRTLIQTALAARATMEVDDKELRVRIAPLSSPHRSRALAAVCEQLNETRTVFPGTRLVLRYVVAQPA